jgi:glycosyltransferase involved in cell wall biosynthesis
MKEYISKTMRGCSIDIIEPTIFQKFTESKFPSKPIVAVHSRDQRDSINFIKSFYVKFPQYRWISFKDMRGISQEEFANTLKDCMVSIWIDDVSSFGTFPIESMACKVPVIGKAPSLVPNWISENNGIWIQELTRLTDILADYIQNWLEDNISESLYLGGLETAKKYQDKEKFESTIESLFSGYMATRTENFKTELNKNQIEQSI